jgi:uncharacterized protein YfaP (DUF2135 family)
VAKKLGIHIVPSKNAKKKIDVLDYYGNYICSIGAYGMNDYEIYLNNFGKKYADERRRLYNIRHQKDMKRLGSAGYYSSKILWRG